MTTHHLILIALGLIFGTICVFMGFCWGKGRSSLDGTPLGIWVGGVSSAFIGGFFEGMPIGGPAGAGFAIADGEVHADFKLIHLAIEAAHVLAIPVGTGLADVRTWIRTNAFPNVFLNGAPVLPPPNPPPPLPAP